MGIDPGTTRIGYGVIEKKRNGLKCIAYGVISEKSPDRLANLRQIVSKLHILIDRYKPEAIAVEKLFFFKNQKTVISVSETRGVILFAIAQAGLPLFEFTPLQIKQALSGYGRAGKVQIQDMVRLVLGLNNNVTPDDAADGLAIAICCANNIVYQVKKQTI